jgi:hypothetical protein
MWKLFLDELNSFFTKVHFNIFVLANFRFTVVKLCCYILQKGVSCWKSCTTRQRSLWVLYFLDYFQNYLQSVWVCLMVHCNLVLKIRYAGQSVRVVCAPNNRAYPERVEVTLI